MKQYPYLLLLSVVTFFFFILKVNALVKVSLNTEFSYYVNPVESSDLSQNLLHINPRIIYSSESKSNSNYFFTDIGASVSSELSDSHIFVPEFFFVYHLQSSKLKKSALIFGRKKMKWSLLEEDWQLSLLDSHLRLNPLYPEKQGLLGVFYKYTTPDFLLKLFVSPIFIPNQSGALDVSGGKIQTYNRWHPFIYYDNALRKKVGYDLEDIDIYNFVQKWSLGFWVKKKISNLYLTASYFYKPYAEPYIYANVSDSIADESTLLLSVLIKVKPIMQQIVFFEGELKQKNFSEYFSIMFDRPQKLLLLDADKYSALANKSILGLGVKYKDLDRELNLGAIHTEFDIIQKSVLDSEKDLRGIDDIYKYPYSTAVFAQAKQKQIFSSSDALLMKYTHILDEKVDIFSFRYTKIIKKHTLVLGLHILGHSVSEQVTGLFASNVANDFIYIGWNYDF